MAQYGRVKLGPKIAFYFLLIIVLIITGMVAFKWMGILQFDTLDPALRFLGVKTNSSNENPLDPYLLDRDRLAKLQDSILLQTEELDLRSMDLENKEVELKQIEDQLAEKQKAQEDREKSFNERVRIYDDKSRNIEANSRKLTGMPPEEAVAILLNMDDQTVIDHLRKTDEIAQAEGTVSLSSYWLSLMPSDRVADVLRKMSRKPGTTE